MIITFQNFIVIFFGEHEIIADLILLIYSLYDYNFSDNKGDYCVILQMVSILLFSFYIVTNNLLVK